MISMDAKLELLTQYWDKVINSMIQNLSKEKDKNKRKRDRELIDMSMKLNPTIRSNFLYEFLKMAKAKHQLAFFQWRDKFAYNPDT
jgi:hypothetical protein